MSNSPNSAPSKYVSGDSPLTVEFRSSASQCLDSAISICSWDFGDGQQSREPNPSHTFDKPGTYEVTLQVMDSQGISAQDASVTVEVRESEPAVLSVNGIMYHLYDKYEMGAAAQGRSWLYRYVLEQAQSLSREQIGSLLNDAVQGLRRRSNVGALNIWFFSQEKNNFMSPSDYDHVLGSANWEASADRSEKPQLLFNEKYLAGTAPRVYGYCLDSQAPLDRNTAGCPECKDHKIALIEILIEGEALCRAGLTNTLLEIFRSFQYANGYVFDIYGKDVNSPLAGQ